MTPDTNIYSDEDDIYSDASMYDSEWGEYEPSDEEITNANTEEEDYNIEEDDDFDYSFFDSETNDDFYNDMLKDPVLKNWVPQNREKTYNVPNTPEAQNFRLLAKSWYSGNPYLDDSVVPGRSAGNTLSVGKYADQATERFMKTGDWKQGLGAVEGDNNQLDTVTKVKSKDGTKNSATGRLQIIKSTREGAYRSMGISPADFAQAEKLYITDAAFQAKVEDTVYNDMMGRINKRQVGGKTNSIYPEDYRASQQERENQLITDYNNTIVKVDLVKNPSYNTPSNSMPKLTTPEFKNNPGNYSYESSAVGMPDIEESIASTINNVGEAYQNIRGIIKQNKKSMAETMDLGIDTASNALAINQNQYNLRQFNQLKNRSRFSKNFNTPNNVPTYV